MDSTLYDLPVSKLYREHMLKKKKEQKLKKKCCEKYMKKKGKYCSFCPTLYAICKHAGKDF